MTLQSSPRHLGVRQRITVVGIERPAIGINPDSCHPLPQSTESFHYHKQRKTHSTKDSITAETVCCAPLGSDAFHCAALSVVILRSATALLLHAWGSWMGFMHLVAPTFSAAERRPSFIAFSTNAVPETEVEGFEKEEVEPFTAGPQVCKVNMEICLSFPSSSCRSKYFLQCPIIQFTAHCVTRTQCNAPSSFCASAHKLWFP